MSKAERRIRNREAHAIRRVLTDADYRECKQRGEDISWRTISEMYAAMPTDQILAEFGDGKVSVTAEQAASRTTGPGGRSDATGPGRKDRARARRKAPPHVAATAEMYRHAKQAWEERLDAVMGGGKVSTLHGGHMTDEERDFRAEFPPPSYKDMLADTYGTMRAEEAASIAA